MDTKTIAQTYFDSWNTREFDRLRPHLTDDVTFSGPMGTASGADDYVRSLAGFAEMLDGVRVLRMVAEGDDVLTWFELVPKGGDPIPVVNWSTFVDGRIARVRVTFDPRPLLE
jgi:hypothetical protein